MSHFHFHILTTCHDHSMQAGDGAAAALATITIWASLDRRREGGGGMSFDYLGVLLSRCDGFENSDNPSPQGLRKFEGLKIRGG